MSCTTGTPTFRILDGVGGWEPRVTTRIAQGDALTLDLRRLGLGSATAAEIERCLLPRWVAIDAGGTCFLIGDDGVVRRKGRCDDEFSAVAAVGLQRSACSCGLCSCDGRTGTSVIDAATAIAASGSRVAIATASGSVLVLDDSGRRVVSRFTVGRIGTGRAARAAGHATALAFTGDELLVATAGRTAGEAELLAVTMVGALVCRWRLASGDEVVALGALPITADGHDLAAVTARADGWRETWPLAACECTRPECGCELTDVEVCCTAELQRPCGEGCGMRCVSVRGRLVGLGAEGLEHWYTPEGQPALPPTTRDERFERSGRLETEPIDGGHEDAQWSRVRIDADIATGGAVHVDLAVVAGPHDTVPEHAWLRVGGLDGLVPGRPRGRYARVRIGLSGDGTATPAVRSVRLDIDVTSLLHDLPGVLAEDPVAADFTDRFLALANVGVEEVGAAIGGVSSLFSAASVRDELLGFVGAAMGEHIDPTWDAHRLRAYLRARPGLEPLRGTAEGMRAAVQAAYGLEVDVTEHGVGRPWGRIGLAPVGSVRLSAASRAAVRLDATPLGSAPIDRGFDPLLGASASGAHRVTVTVPWTAATDDPTSAERAGIERLIRSWCPAHLGVTVRFSAGRVGFGGVLRLGIDTTLRGLPVSVLRGKGEQACRLQHSSVVARGTRFANRPIVLGLRSNVGMNTTLG